MGWIKGKKLTEQHKQNIRLSKIGKKQNKNIFGERNPMFGKHHTNVTKIQISNKLLKDNVTYTPLHLYVRKWKPKPIDGKCEYCHEKPFYDLANVTGNYNREFINWRYLCRSCYMRSDGRMKNLRNQK